MAAGNAVKIAQAAGHGVVGEHSNNRAGDNMDNLMGEVGAQQVVLKAERRDGDSSDKEGNGEKQVKKNFLFGWGDKVKKGEGGSWSLCFHGFYYRLNCGFVQRGVYFGLTASELFG